MYVKLPFHATKLEIILTQDREIHFVLKSALILRVIEILKNQCVCVDKMYESKVHYVQAGYKIHILCLPTFSWGTIRMITWWSFFFNIHTDDSSVLEVIVPTYSQNQFAPHFIWFASRVKRNFILKCPICFYKIAWEIMRRHSDTPNLT